MLRSLRHFLPVVMLSLAAVACGRRRGAANQPPQSSQDRWVKYAHPTAGLFAQFPSAPEVTERVETAGPLDDISVTVEAVWKSPRLTLRAARVPLREHGLVGQPQALEIARRFIGRGAEMRIEADARGGTLKAEGRSPASKRRAALVLRWFGKAVYVAVATGQLDRNAARFLDSARFEPVFRRVGFPKHGATVALPNQALLARPGPTESGSFRQMLIGALQAEPNVAYQLAITRREKESAATIIAGTRRYFLKERHFKLLRQRRFQFRRQYPAQDLQMKAPEGKGYIWARVVLTEHSDFSLMVSAPSQDFAFGADSKRFMDSLHPNDTPVRRDGVARHGLPPRPSLSFVDFTNKAH